MASSARRSPARGGTGGDMKGANPRAVDFRRQVQSVDPAVGYGVMMIMFHSIFYVVLHVLRWKMSIFFMFF